MLQKSQLLVGFLRLRGNNGARLNVILAVGSAIQLNLRLQVSIGSLLFQAV